jgi:multicomponent Na+:H+ antiporter subunit D
MPTTVALQTGPSAAGLLLVLALVVPVTGLLLAFALGGRGAERVVMAVLPLGLLVALAIVAAVFSGGSPITYDIGGWAPPLGVALRADGLAAAMLLTTAVVVCAVALFARAAFPSPESGAETRAPLVFWTLLLAIWAALNAIWVSGDMFTLYVALELLTFAAVPLVCLDGSAATLAAALRYLLFALLGSVLYLLGTALLYGAYGTLDITLLAGRVRPEPAAWTAAALMTAGLLAKTALFPLHLWLPPAHAGAPPAASALLSSLVVKGSFFITIRLWFDVMPAMLTPAVAQFLAALGSAAIIVGSVLALRQARLKLMIAYSTIAQIGYLFFVFPLAAGALAGGSWNSIAWTGGALQVISHAIAKAAMFMAAGLMAETVGHDRIDGLGGIVRVVPITVLAFALAGMSLMGLPPSGGFVAKWRLLTAAVFEGQWWWAVVILTGGLLAGGYVFRVVAPAVIVPNMTSPVRAEIPRNRQAVVLALAILAVLLGLLPIPPSQLLLIGRQ